MRSEERAKWWDAMKAKEVRLIIRNWSDKPMNEILQRAKQVVELGRVSGRDDHYCYFVRFADGLVCSTRKNSSKSDTLTFYEEERE